MSGENDKGGRRRPSGLNAHERRFATVINPDGSKAKIPAAKDACTYIYITTDGHWPERSSIVLLYDVAHLIERSVFTIKEMRDGHGMGNLRTFDVLKSDVIVEHHPGNYGQVQRLLLCREITSNDDMAALNIDDLEGA